MNEPHPEPMMPWRFIRRHSVRIVIGSVLVAMIYGALLVWTPYQDRDGQLSSDEIDVICALIQSVADDQFVLTGARVELKHLSIVDAIGNTHAIDRWPEVNRQPYDVAIATALVSRNENVTCFNSESLRKIGARLGKNGFEMDGRFFTRKIGTATPPSIGIAVAIPGISVKDGVACTFAKIINSKVGSAFVVWSRMRRSEDGWRCTEERGISFE